jgi:hypothetical protein
MAESNEFTCPNKHPFKAVAKLRARCPNCGLMARRNFNSPVPAPTKITTKITGRSEPSPSSSVIPRKVDKSKTSRVGLKPASTLEKEKLSSVTPRKVSKSLPESQPSVRKLVVVKQGRPRAEMPKKKVTPKLQAKIATPSTGVVRRKVAKVGTHPAVRKKPVGSKERKVVEQVGGGKKRFWEEAKDKYFSR